MFFFGIIGLLPILDFFLYLLNIYRRQKWRMDGSGRFKHKSTEHVMMGARPTGKSQTYKKKVLK